AVTFFKPADALASSAGTGWSPIADVDLGSAGDERILAAAGGLALQRGEAVLLATVGVEGAGPDHGDTYTRLRVSLCGARGAADSWFGMGCARWIEGGWLAIDATTGRVLLPNPQNW